MSAAVNEIVRAVPRSASAVPQPNDAVRKLRDEREKTEQRLALIGATKVSAGDDDEISALWLDVQRRMLANEREACVSTKSNVLRWLRAASMKICTACELRA